MEKGTLFAELSKAEGETWHHLQSLPVDGTPIFSALDEGEYLTLLQPALKQAINSQLGLSIGGSLPFPVEGKDQRAIWSSFGDPRDGGRRAHHGVDIFAKRGTPVYAVTKGRVQTHTTPRGGQVIWLQDSYRSVSYYYAHLDEVRVVSGQRVISGEIIGAVGNTGNAMSTPPHLHFGIYARFRGPADPLPYIQPPPQAAAFSGLDIPALGMLRITATTLRLRSGPSIRASILQQLPNGSLLRAVANVGDWYRIELKEGGQGFVSAQWIEPLPSTTQPL